MKIVFNSNITEVRVFPDRSLRFDTSLYLGKGRVKIGTKFGIFPVYKRVEGLFHSWSQNYWGTIEEYNKEYSKNRFVTPEGEFYYKPHCSIHMNNGKFHDVFFDTDEELNKYVDELKGLAPHIILN